MYNYYNSKMMNMMMVMNGDDINHQVNHKKREYDVFILSGIGASHL